MPNLHIQLVPTLPLPAGITPPLVLKSVAISASPKVSATTRGNANPGRTFNVRDTRSGRLFLVNTGAIPRTTGGRRCPYPSLILQTANTSLIATCLFSLDIGLWRLFLWVFVVADIPCLILSADFLANIYLLVDCRQSCLHDKTTNLTVRRISSNASRQLAVLDPEPENPCRMLLAKYFGLTRPKFSLSTPPHDAVHHTRTTGPPVFSRHVLLPPRPSSSTYFRRASSINLKAHGPHPSFPTMGLTPSLTKGAQFESNLFESSLFFQVVLASALQPIIRQPTGWSSGFSAIFRHPYASQTIWGTRRTTSPWSCWASIPLSSRTLTAPLLNWCSAPPSDFLVR
ncbi:hypothetical protein SprV_0401568900 [Sparganum proliferum]